jgi:hypothetical protein
MLMVLMLHYISLYLACYQRGVMLHYISLYLACYQQAAVPFHPFPSGHHDLDKLLSCRRLDGVS